MWAKWMFEATALIGPASCILHKSFTQHLPMESGTEGNCREKSEEQCNSVGKILLLGAQTCSIFSVITEQPGIWISLFCYHGFITETVLSQKGNNYAQFYIHFFNHFHQFEQQRLWYVWLYYHRMLERDTERGGRKGHHCFSTRLWFCVILKHLCHLYKKTV